jgi:hypothetical protein
MDLYIHSPVYIQGVVRNLLSTGTTLFIFHDFEFLTAVAMKSCLLDYTAM